MKRGERESGGACKSATPGPMDGQREARRYVQTSRTVSNPGSEARISEETFGNRGTRPWPPFRKRDFNQILPFHQFLLLLSPLDFPFPWQILECLFRRGEEGREFCFPLFSFFPFLRLEGEIDHPIYAITKRGFTISSRVFDYTSSDDK